MIAIMVTPSLIVLLYLHLCSKRDLTIGFLSSMESSMIGFIRLPMYPTIFSLIDWISLQSFLLLWPSLELPHIILYQPMRFSLCFQTPVSKASSFHFSPFVMVRFFTMKSSLFLGNPLVCLFFASVIFSYYATQIP